MTKKYRFLALTDHRGHSKENSLYALMRTLYMHPLCERIDVASRGNHLNDAFFEDRKGQLLQVLEVDKNFTFDETGAQFLNTGIVSKVSHYDVILMRLPRPVSDEFLDYLADTAADKVIINHPKGIQETSSKAWLTNFPALCPAIKLCHSINEVLDFAEQFPIVLKPLREYGGKGIVKIEGDVLYEGKSPQDAKTYLKKIEPELQKEGYLAMKFLKNVSEGDKRILVANGVILAASLRLPAADSWLCNVAQGGTSVATEVMPEEVEIVDSISPALREAGILIYGVDTLVDDDGKRILSEVNTLSIGGFPQAEQQTGKPVLQQTIEEIMKYVVYKNEKDHQHA